MKGFAAFILTGYGRAVLCVAGFAWFAMFVPLAGMVSSATLGLTALKWGPQRAVIVLALSTAALFAVGSLAAGLGLTEVSYAGIFLFALLQWLPVVIIARLLQVASLSFTLNVLMGAGIIMVALVALLVPESAALWDRFFNWILQGALRSRETGDPDFGEDYRSFLNVMTGVAMASLILVWMTSLLLARWWCSLLDNPGGFRTEFVALKLGRIAAVAGLSVFAVMTFSGWPLMRELLLVMMAAFLFQGIATVHGLLCVLRNPGGWLLAFYLALALSPVVPQVPGVLSMFGAVENLVGLRARMKAKLESKRE